MKKALRTIGALLLATALIIAFIPVSDAEAATSAPDFQMEGSRLVKYAGSAEIVNIPDDVKSIGEEAFAGNNTLTKVTIPAKCTSIGYGAFSNCRSLRIVETGDGVEEIDAAAFSGDSVLTNLTLGANVKKIGSAVFAGDTSLYNLTVSPANQYLTLQNNVLYNSELTKLYCMLPTFSDGIYNMPNSVQEMTGYAFWGNTNIRNVNLGSGLAAVPAYAFSNCSNLRQVVIPLPVRSIEQLAFENCPNLSLVKIPDSVTRIADNAFNGCPKVTIDASAGSYADRFASSMKRTPAAEVEYEDVEQAPLVTVENNAAQPSDEEGDSPDSLGEYLTDIIDGQNPEQNPGQSDEDNPPVSNEASGRFSNGVINGADVISYTYYDAGSEPTGLTYGSSVVAGGHALVFIDNKPNVYGGTFDLGQGIEMPQDNSGNVQSELPEGAYTPDPNRVDDEDTRPLADILSETASKGIRFPKFTIAGDRIATQAYYGNQALTEYEFPEGITSVGDFAFARSGLTSISIPEGVRSIGYGAFYHCDDLTDVYIPSTVTDISAYAFENTPYLENASDEYLIAGDGVLIAYKGSDSVATIPEGVKHIADGAFRDHAGLTAVNLPDSLLTIGEEAFRGCGNLSTVNRGDNLESIGANAFRGTALSNVTIPSTVTSIGLGAYDLLGGTDTVTFLGTSLPGLVSGDGALRLGNAGDRTYAFGSMTRAVVPQGAVIEGSVLNQGIYGFQGLITDEFGNTIQDNSTGVAHRTSSGAGILVESISGMMDGSQVTAKIAGDEGNYLLRIHDSQNASDAIAKAYGELYGGRYPQNLRGLDICLYDDTGTAAITKLGKQTVDITMPVPPNMSLQNMHVVSLDSDGQLEAVPYSLSEDGKQLTIRCGHFSPYGIYNYADSADDLQMDGKTRIGTKDLTPDTGDIPIHPKWFLVIGCGALAILCILIGFGRKRDAE